MRRSPLVLLALTTLVCARGADAQHERWESTSWVDDLNFASANAIIAGLTAGIVSELRGRSFTRGFAGGALGGSVAYLGKRLTAARFDGAGLLGRQVAAAGVSITRNASTSGGLLDSLMVPVGPVRVTLSPSSGNWPTLRLDAHDTYWLLYGLADDRLAFDAGRSLSAGTPVFMTDALLGNEDERALGQFVGGAIVITRRSGAHLEAAFAHERVHALQHDFLKHTIGYAVEDWLRSAVDVGTAGWQQHLLVGVGHFPLLPLVAGRWPMESRLLEVEAYFLEMR